MIGHFPKTIRTTNITFTVAITHLYLNYENVLSSFLHDGYLGNKGKIFLMLYYLGFLLIPPNVPLSIEK